MHTQLERMTIDHMTMHRITYGLAQLRSTSLAQRYAKIRSRDRYILKPMLFYLRLKETDIVLIFNLSMLELSY